MALTPKQERFVQEYLIDLNATQAAIRAGYSERTADQIGSELLRKTLVADAIEQAKAERAKEAKIDAAWVLDSLKKLHDRCVQATPVLDRKGNPILVEDADGNLAVAYTFQASSAAKSLELIGKHVGVQAFAADKLELSGTVNLADRMSNARKRARGDDEETT